MATSAWPVKILNATSSSLTSFSTHLDTFVHVCDCPFASVVVRSESQAFLNATSVTQDSFNRDHFFVIKAPSIEDVGINRVQYSVDVYVPQSSLNQVSADETATVVVSPSALNSNADSTYLIAANNASIYVSGASFQARSLGLRLIGPGRIQFDVTNVALSEQLVVKSDGYATNHGTVFFRSAALNTPLVTVDAASDANVYVLATSVTKYFGIDTTVHPSGIVVVDIAGVCNDLRVHLIGDCKMYSSGTACHDTRVDAVYSGMAFVRATESLTTTLEGDGVVYLVGDQPRMTKGSFTPIKKTPERSYTLYSIPTYGPSTLLFGLVNPV
ncbi:hypothetical protein ACHHYP_14733, partial [Achlya hypogyna]